MSTNDDTFVVVNQTTNLLSVVNDPSVIVTSEHDTVIISNSNSPSVIMTGPMIGGSNNMNTLNNVDVSNLSTGSILIYQENTQKWTSSKNLDQQFLDGGQF